MSHTALVNVDAATTVKVASFIADLTGEEKSAFLAVCEEKMDQPADLLQTFLSKTDLILALENEKDAEGCFQAFVALLNSGVSDSADELRVIQTLIDSLSASEKSAVVLRIFVSVFNLLRSASSKFHVLKAILSYAIKSNQANLVTKFEAYVATWLTLWGLTLVEQRELFLLMADTLFASDQQSRGLFFLTQYLNTFKAGEEYPSEVVTVATKAIVSAIRAPVSLYKDRNALSKTLAGHSTTDATLLKLIELLRIFCVGTVDSYVQFYNSNKDLFAKFDVCHDTSLKNMRLLGLCALAARSTTSAGFTQVLAYSDIAKALDVSSDEEVEEWVVEAISHGLLEAAMDQLNGVITVSRCVRMSFEHDEWVTLQQKLSSWRNNLTSVLEVMRSHLNNPQ